MARVLTIIETSCPSALTKKVMKHFTHLATCTLLWRFHYFSLPLIYNDDSKSVNTGRHSDVWRISTDLIFPPPLLLSPIVSPFQSFLHYTHWSQILWSCLLHRPLAHNYSSYFFQSLQAAADEVLINLDALTPRCFHDVNSFTLSCLIGGGVKKKKRPSSQVVGTADAALQSGHLSSSGEIAQIPKKSNTHKKVRA